MKKFISSLLICAGVSSIALPNFCYATGEDKGTIVINQYFGDSQESKKDILSNSKKEKSNENKNNTSVEEIIHFAKYTLKKDEKSEEKVDELIKAFETYKKEIKAEKDRAWRAEFNSRLHDARSKFFEKILDGMSFIALSAGVIGFLGTYIWATYKFAMFE